MARYAAGVVVSGGGPHGGIHMPKGGVEVLADEENRIYAVRWEMEDTREQPTTGVRHRWRYTVPAEAIQMVIEDLGAVVEPEPSVPADVRAVLDGP